MLVKSKQAGVFLQVLLGISLLLGLTHPAAAEEGKSLTLSGAVQIALHGSPELQQSANQVATGAIVLSQKKSNFAPDLRLGANVSERFDRTTGVTGSLDNRSSTTASASLSSGLNLFNGFGDLAAVESADRSLAANRYSYTRQQQTLIFNTTTHFVQTITDRELIAVQQENLARNRLQLEQIDAMVKAGSRALSDLYQQQAETSKAELGLLTAERDFVVNRMQLLQTIGLEPTTPVAIEASANAQLEEDLLRTGRAAQPPAQRPDLLAQQQRQEAALANIEQAKAGYWPTLDLSASIGSNYNSLFSDSFSQQMTEDNRSAAIGLTLNYAIFDRNLTRNNVAKARIDQNTSDLELQKIQLQAGVEQGQAQQDFVTAQQQLTLTEARLVAARQNLAAKEERYRVGASSLVELTQARTDFITASYDRVIARYALMTRAMAVAYASGDEPQMHALLTTWESRK